MDWADNKIILALFAATLGFLIRYALDLHGNRKIENRFAYVFLIKISQIIATHETIKEKMKPLFEALSSEPIRRFLSEKDKAFDPGDAMLVVIANAFRKMNHEPIWNIPGCSTMVLKFIDDFESSSKAAVLTPEQLAKFPKNIILEYYLFQRVATHSGAYLPLYKSYFEKHDVAWITAEHIGGQIEILRKIFRSAHLLQSAIIKHCGISQLEANSLVKKLKEAANVDSEATMKLLNQLKAARLALEPAMESSKSSPK